MKKNDTHPQYHTKIKITCACGAEFESGSTLDSISIEVCSQCHPFYTGTQKFLDTARRVEKFKEKVKKGKAALKTKVNKKEKEARRAKIKADKAAKVTETVIEK